MTVEVTIPQSIIETCKECGWDEQETKKHFGAYLHEVMNHPYGQMELDFGVWLEDLVEEE